MQTLIKQYSHGPLQEDYVYLIPRKNHHQIVLYTTQKIPLLALHQHLKLKKVFQKLVNLLLQLNLLYTEVINFYQYEARNKNHQLNQQN